MARTITFQPSRSMSEFIEAMVSSGNYNNQSEVIRAALRLLQEQDASSKLNALRLLIEEGEQSEDDINFSIDSLKKRLDSR
ncbi:type II toxin-antitoxin system ParD family antitoxin [Alteromonas macleodii]|uniref:type II toxin-antitoxin system ParD family antitoxin n=1 Tax=Alteromonas macleodii TaxID=28108 RepID=UPI003CFF6DCF